MTKQYVNLEIDDAILEKAAKKAKDEGRSRKRQLEIIIEQSLLNN